MENTSLFLGHFEFVKILRMNGGTAVALCRDPNSRQHVVCKTAISPIPSDEIVASLKREFELTQKVQASDIVTLLPLEKSETGCPIVVTTYFKGEHFGSGNDQLSPHEYIPLFIRLVKAIDSIHSKKIIHRDLNPSNILWDRETGELLIIDFSLASDLLTETVKSDAIESLYGTLPFIAPEQTGRMNRKVDFRSDYYSLGMTLYQFLTNSLPFDASDAIGWVYCHITEKPTLASKRNPAIPLEIAAIVDKLLSKNAEDRYQSGYGLIKDLELAMELFNSGKKSAFIPGEKDIQEWLTIPEKLYGRENELLKFLTFFEKVKAGEKLICSIEGPSGMGKSVLVNEIDKPVVSVRGHFVSGKCDQYKRNDPYSAIKGAFADLVREYLAKSAEDIEMMRKHLIEALGDNAYVLTEIIPELEAITGPSKAVPILPPNEARVRFQRSFEKMLQTFTSSGKPLVVFLDDLQWSDIPSLRLIEFLMTEADLRFFMIVAVFRDNEVTQGHQLLLTLDEIRKSRDIPTIKLSPLSKMSIRNLLADTFHHKPMDTVELAEILYTKTSGNPFHITEMIKTLHEADAIHFDRQNGKWIWSIEKIASAGISDDVVELMLSTLQKCTVSAQDKLKIAACIGAQFELNTLASVCGTEAHLALNDLWGTIEKGLIIPLGESYKLLKSGMQTEGKHFFFKFQHDRVHEAAYKLIQDKDRPLFHLKIGRILRKIFDDRVLENQVIDVVRHYNLGSDHITDQGERTEVCHLNYMAAIKARNSIAFDAWLNFLDKARTYLPERPWSTHYGLARKVYMGLSEASFFSGNNELASNTNAQLLANVSDTLDLAELQNMRMAQTYYSGNPAEAIKIALKSLSDLGVRFPKNPGKFKFLSHVHRTKKILKKIDLDKFNYDKALNDRRISLVQKHLVQLTTIFFSVGDRISTGICVMEILRLSILHGISLESGYGFVGTASVFGGTLGLLGYGHRLAKSAIELDMKYGTQESKMTIYNIYSAFIAPFNLHLERIQEVFDVTIEASLASGDRHFSSTAAAICLSVNPNLNLEEACEKSENYYLPIIAKSNLKTIYEMALSLHRFRLAIVDGLDDGKLEAKNNLDDSLVDFFVKSKYNTGLFIHYTFNAFLLYLFDDHRKAYQQIKKAHDSFLSGRGTFHETEFHFFNVLISSAVYREVSRLEQKSIEKSIKYSIARMRMFSEHHSHNYRHRYLTMLGAQHKMHGNLHAASECYERALDNISKAFTRDIGVINELNARVYLEDGKRKIAQVYIRDAYIAFQTWKAHGKIKRLLDEWPLLNEEWNSGHGQLRQSRLNPSLSISIHSTHQGAGKALDVASITRAAQTLSSQVEMENLIKSMMKIIVENAGAHYAVLMLKDKENGQTRVVANISNQTTTIFNNIALSEFHEISLSVMLYTTRVGGNVIIDDLEKDRKFSSDFYLQNTKPKSIMAMPITVKGEVIGFFYLENRMVAGSFTADRVEILNILGTQAAISLENANLYATLENKVRERTEQLAEKSRDIQTILSNIKQGILTVSEDLIIHEEHSSYLEVILDETNIARKSLMESVFKDVELNIDTVNQIKSALIFSIQQPLFGFSSNEGLLVREVSRKRKNGENQILEFDWEPIVNNSNIVEKIMVTIRDVTDLRKLREISKRNAQELNILNQLLNTSPSQYLSFSKNTFDLVRKANDLLSTAKPNEIELINVAYRHLHTAKGNSRYIGFTDLAGSIHDSETILDKMRCGNIDFNVGRKSIQTAIVEVFGILKDYQAVYETKLLAYSSSETNHRFGKLISILEKKINEWKNKNENAASEISAILKDLDKESLPSIIEPLKKNTAVIARSHGKEHPIINVEGPNLLFNSDASRILTNVFIHLLSNSIIHGIESPEERLHCSKTKTGQITISVAEKSGNYEFSVYDDGRGLDLTLIREKALSKGIISPATPLNDHETAGLIFKSGFSTADELSQSAGRGVGMDAVLDLIHDAGGTLELVLKDWVSTNSNARAFMIKFTLPTKNQSAAMVAA